jgi:hypothetical protein
MDHIGIDVHKKKSQMCMVAEGVSSSETRRLLIRRPGQGYFTGIIRCWYGVPGHITYGFRGSSALFG